MLDEQEVELNNEVEGEDTPSLADWKNPPTVADLKQDYEESRSFHDKQVLKISKWLDNLNVRGAARVKTPVGRSKHVPKLIRKQAEWRYASLSEPFLSTDDLFNVDPITHEDKPGAYQNGLVLNNQFNTKIRKINFIDEYIRTAVDEGTVVSRVGWVFEEKEQEVEVPVFQQMPVQDPEQAQAMLQQGVPPYEEVQVGTQLEMQMVTVKNHPTVEVCDYRNVIIDPTCQGDMDKANFVINCFETSASELEKAGIYTNLDKINITNVSPLAYPDHASNAEDINFNFKDEPRKRIMAYEYWGNWDIDGTGVVKPIVATYVGNTMIRLEENPFPDGKPPFVIAQYLPVRKSVYGEPDGELLEENQKIIGAVTRGMIDIMARSANGQTATRKDALDVTNKRRFQRGEDYEFNPNVDPRQAFHMHTYAEIPRSAHDMVQLQNNEAESLTGKKSFSEGISGKALGNTATGVRSAMDSAAQRELGILRRMAEGVKEIGRKIIAMNAEFLEEEEVIRVTNEEFVPVRRDDLAGNYDLTLTISTAEADNQKAEEIAFQLQTMGQTLPFELTQMLLADQARLRKMPDLAKKIQEFQPQPDPMAQKKAELEVALLEAQVANEQAKGQENAVDVQLKTAKTYTEQAKARHLGSQSDKTDLDFLEQESGTNHARDLDKMDRQRDADLDREAGKAFLAEGSGNSPG